MHPSALFCSYLRFFGGGCLQRQIERWQRNRNHHIQDSRTHRHPCSKCQMIWNRASRDPVVARPQRENVHLTGVWLDQLLGMRGPPKNSIMLRSPYQEREATKIHPWIYHMIASASKLPHGVALLKHPVKNRKNEATAVTRLCFRSGIFPLLFHHKRLHQMHRC